MVRCYAELHACCSLHALTIPYGASCHRFPVSDLCKHAAGRTAWGGRLPNTVWTLRVFLTVGFEDGVVQPASQPLATAGRPTADAHCISRWRLWRFPCWCRHDSHPTRRAEAQPGLVEWLPPPRYMAMYVVVPSCRSNMPFTKSGSAQGFDSLGTRVLQIAETANRT